MSCFERLQAYLAENGVPFEIQHHPLAYTAHEVAASEHVAARQMAKVVMVVADGVLAMLVLPASSRVDEAVAGQTVDVLTLRLATEYEFRQAFPDCDLGAMPPFGNLYGIPVYVDETLADQEFITFQAGTHTETMRIAYADFDRLVKPVAGPLTTTSLLSAV